MYWGRPGNSFDGDLRNTLAHELALTELTPRRPPTLRGYRSFLDALDAIVTEFRRIGDRVKTPEQQERARISAILADVRRLRAELARLGPDTLEILDLVGSMPLIIDAHLEVTIAAIEEVAPRPQRGERGPAVESTRVRNLLFYVFCLYTWFYTEDPPSPAKIRHGLRRLVLLLGIAGYPPIAPKVAGEDPIYRLALREFKLLRGPHAEKIEAMARILHSSRLRTSR